MYINMYIKAELLRTRKKLESDVAELETSLEHANQVEIISFSFSCL